MISQPSRVHRPVNGTETNKPHLKRINAMSLPEKIRELRGGDSTRVSQLLASIEKSFFDTLLIKKYSSSISFCFDDKANIPLQECGKVLLKGFAATLKDSPKEFFTPENIDLLRRTFCSNSEIEKIIASKSKKR